jgi:ribonuclease PH
MQATPETRAFGRAADALRPVLLEPNVNKHAEGSCLARFGDTHVSAPPASRTGCRPSCATPAAAGSPPNTACCRAPPTPAATARRRAASQRGRTQEIQRLIGRSLRAVTDLGRLGERQITIDCDVIQADGGTRTAAITGAYVALHLALQHLQRLRAITAWPLVDHVAAVSCGLSAAPPCSISTMPRTAGPRPTPISC